jgi:hypothetical protein
LEADCRDKQTGGKGRFTKAARHIEDAVAQWLWFTLPVDPERIGYGEGPLTWLRQRKHKKSRKHIHICLLDYLSEGGRQSKFTEFWINERSRLCSASMNEGIEYADVLWTYCKDPISPHKKDELLQVLKRARPGTPIINHPEVYNSYHEERAFKTLAEAGVSVPRSEFSDRDVGKTLVIYKTKGRHGHAPKFLSEYEGSKAGYRAFEFVSSRSPDGLNRRYRAYYLLGAICPSLLRTSGNWNVYSQTAERTEPYTMRSNEADQIRLIAKTLDLQYFAVDYLRRKEDDSPVFVDLNVYPDVISKLRDLSVKFGYYGRWHTLDTDAPWLSLAAETNRAGLESLGRRFWDVFDNAMLSFLEKETDSKQ